MMKKSTYSVCIHLNQLTKVKKVIFYFKCTLHLMLCNQPKQNFIGVKNENVKMKICDLLFLSLRKKGCQTR